MVLDKRFFLYNISKTFIFINGSMISIEKGKFLGKLFSIKLIIGIIWSSFLMKKSGIPGFPVVLLKFKNSSSEFFDFVKLKGSLKNKPPNKTVGFSPGWPPILILEIS